MLLWNPDSTLCIHSFAYLSWSVVRLLRNIGRERRGITHDSGRREYIQSQWLEPELAASGHASRQCSNAPPGCIQCHWLSLSGRLSVYLVDHGGGCLIVNGDAYSLEAGSCCLLFVHHFYSIKPSQSVPLTLLSCLFSYSTYTFLTTISQFDFLSIDVPSPPNFANFSPQEMVHIQRIVAALSKPGIGANGKAFPSCWNG